MTTRSAPRRPGRPSRPTARSRSRAALALALIVVGQLLAVVPVRAGEPGPAAVPATRPQAEQPAPTTDAADGVGDVLPGVQYEEAMAHADDRIEFAPGGRVTVGFRPRAGDAWEVGGRAPRALPAGTASGRDMLPTRTGTGPTTIADPSPAEPPADPSPDAPAPDASAQPSDAPADTPVDAPTVDPSEIPEADGASAQLPLATDGIATNGTRLHRQVMGFLPYWEVNDAVLDYELLSTIAYFSVGADKNGNLLKLDPDGTPTTGWGGWTSSRMTSIINGAHSKGTRVVLTISVFAWSSGQAALQGALLGNPTARLNLARQAAAAVRARGADGINLDFEPIASGYADEYTAFVRTVRAELNKQAPGYQLTFDTTGFIGNYPIAEATAPGGADAIFIMGYDYRTGSSNYVGSIDPLSGPAYDLQDTVNAYAARVSPSKLILGVPWYGRAWSTVSDTVNAQNQSGTKFGSSNTVVLDTALDYAKQYGRRWDSREQSAWVAYRRENCSATYGCVTSWRQLYFDDGPAVKARYDLINRMGLRGAGIWALGYDADRIEMRQALAEKFLNDRTAPLAGIRTLAPVQSAEGFNVSWVGRDETGVSSFDVQVSVDGGPWVGWLDNFAGTSGAYMGANGHGFAFRVRARDVAGNVGPWDVSTVYRSQRTMGPGEFGRVVSDTLNVRSSADTSAAIVDVVDAGTLLAITGGPVNADGYTWYEVTVPITEWSPVAGVTRNVWVAARSSTTTLLALSVPPNTTSVRLPAGTQPAGGGRFVPIDPGRILDSRSGNGLSGPFPSGVARTFQVTGRGGIPAGALSITGTLTVVGQTSPGNVSLGRTAATVGRTTLINTPTGEIRGAGLTMSVGVGGTLTALWTGAPGSTAHLVLDVTGYFLLSSGGTYVPVTPTRLLDTRGGNGLSGPSVANSLRTLQVAGRGGVPLGATAVTVNVTAVAPNASGYLSIGGATTAASTTSTAHARAGDIRATSGTLRLDGSGRVGIVWRAKAGTSTHVILDVTGYFTTSGAGATFHGFDPVRVLDTRYGNGLAAPFASGVARSFQAGGRGTVPANAVALSGSLAVIRPSAAGYVSIGPSTTGLLATSSVNLPRDDVRANGLTVKAGPSGMLTAVFRGASGSRSNVLLDLTGYFR